MRVKIVCIVFSICIFLLSGCIDQTVIDSQNETEGEYFISRINDCDNVYNNEKYFYYTYNQIYCYDFKTEQNEKICESESPIYGLAVQSDWLYYVINEGKDYQIVKHNYVSQENCILLEHDGLIELAIKQNYLLYKYNNYCIKLCSIDGEIDQDSIDVNELFESDDYSGKEQVAVYDGISITRYFDEEAERYVISVVRDYDTQISLFQADTGITMSDGSRVDFYSEYDGIKNFYYQKSDKTSGLIDCLSGEEFEFSDIFSELLTEDQGQIIGLISVSTHPIQRRGSYQEYVKCDVLFKLDPKTGENSIIYNTENNQNKIIGYQDGVIYLFGNNTVYSMLVDGGAKTELFTLASGGSYVFDWQEGYLIVRNGKEPYEVIEIWEKE